ncbi:hypothetical protein [Streptomyces sp. NPDC059122]|uniref:hypothetical protein n=1 Tax=Streptomyces sp. NPDC059122 TaxID=3346732 RepID=UPI00368098B6
MPKARYHHQSPIWAVVSSAEAIMPPFTCDETLKADVLTVTAPGSLIATALILPFMVNLTSTESVTTAALAMACLRTTSGTQVSYQRIRQNITGDHRNQTADRR